MVAARPIKKFKAANIEVAIWNNKKQVDGNEVSYKTLSLSRKFRKKGEEIWRNEVINMRRSDIQKALIVLQKAQEDLFLGGDSSE